MIDQAIEKINAEMQKDPSNRFMEIVGHYIIDRCADDGTAAKVMDGKKTLKGAINAVMARAQEARNGNAAILLPGDVFGEVDRHFGLSTDISAQQKAMASADPSAAIVQAAPPAPHARVGVDLLDFF